jgi:hypothetical protein
MVGLLIVLAIIAAIVVFDLLAQTHGVDSRPEFDDPRAPVRGITV